jgi:phenylacetate-CoA ligase
MYSQYLDPFIETLGREALTQIQIKKFQMMLGEVLQSNKFYRRKLLEAGVKQPADVQTVADLRALPFTSKTELSSDQASNPPYGTNLTYPRQHYTRIHQTSGTTGEPLRCLDTDESWQWWVRCWSTVYKATGVTPMDRVFFAFSFGPFIGFWSGYEGAQSIGALALSGGGMSSYQRLKAMLANDVSVLVCTPTYALHLAETAEQEGINIADSNVRITIHAGEPGASLPATKQRIEKAWGARSYDHAGATEVGAWGFECMAQQGVHVNEGEFFAEVIDPDTGEAAEHGELVLTNLGRIGMPIIRYRTGDRARLQREPCECGRTYMRLEGGVTGRVDDVLVIRGVNVVPSAIENMVRSVPQVGEFAADVYRRGQLDQMTIRIEVNGTEPGPVVDTVAREIRNALGLRVHVESVPYGSLPRFDLKAKRFTDHRQVGQI